MKIRYFIPVLFLLVCTGVVQANKSFSGASRVISQNTIEVGSISELIHAVNNSNPGDLILIEDGNYSGSNIILKAKGTKGNPIAIKAKNPGKVFFESRIEIEGDYIQIDGINFIENGNLEIFGTGSLVTNCIWNDSKSGKWLRVLPGSSRIEIDHNTF